MVTHRAAFNHEGDITALTGCDCRHSYWVAIFHN